MGSKGALVCLLLVTAAVLQCSSQHWSHGLSPGGKREADSPRESQVMEGLPRRGGARCGSDTREAANQERPSTLEQLISLMSRANEVYD
ncbi:progonadoliberin-1-like [Engraulis encrasicolus]|uniref:progonadoliberin-1-like n=1 Tax=Engraulis encrasicolus TaxID=184585 RepID=UPI002FD56897